MSTDSRRVRIVGAETPERRVVEDALSDFDVETIPSVAALVPSTADVVIVVLSALDVSASTAVEHVGWHYNEASVVVAVEEVPTVRATAVVPIGETEIRRTVEQVLGDERVLRAQQRSRRIRQLTSPLDDSVSAERICRRLLDAVGYDSVWLARIEESAVVPVAAAGVPISALRSVDLDESTPWARALQSGDAVVEDEGGEETATVVAVPFADRCLVCTTTASVGVDEVAAIEEVVSSLAALDGALRPRYALLGEAVAHEVNNQLDLAMVQLELIDANGEHIDTVESALERIGEVVDEVGALVSQGLTTQSVALKATAEEVWSGVSASEATLDVSPGDVEADERLLRLLLSNLFRNAVQHGGEAVTVEVGPLDDGGFYVADDGVGFSERVGSQLFEWGWSGGDSTGIGLAIVSLAADRHGWEVSATGDDGARFEFLT